MATLELFGCSIWIGNGQVDYIDPDFASPDDSFYPKEDLLQISFPTTLLLDVGWYPEGHPQGAFEVRAIHNFDWVDPVFKMRAKDVPTMLEAMSQAVIRMTHLQLAQEQTEEQRSVTSCTSSTC